MTQDNTTALDDLLTDWRQQAATAEFRRERDKGTTFENLCIAYLQHDPIQARQYEQPMSYSDWAQVPERRNDRVAEPLGFYAEPERSAQDLGIDLVAKLRDEEGWCAIQCKFHATGSRIAKADIDSFLAASGHKDFRQRLIIDTTGREWNSQAEEMLRRPSGAGPADRPARITGQPHPLAGLCDQQRNPPRRQTHTLSTSAQGVQSGH